MAARLTMLFQNQMMEYTIQGEENKHSETIIFGLNFKPQIENEYAMVLEDNKTSVEYKRNINGFDFKKGWCPPHPTFFVRKRVYEQYGYFNLDYRIAADVELMIRFMETHRIPIKFIPEIWVNMKTGGTTNKNIRNIWKQNREIWNALNKHKLYPSLIEFTVGKLISRTRQYLSRP